MLPPSSRRADTRKASTERWPAAAERTGRVLFEMNPALSRRVATFDCRRGARLEASLERLRHDSRHLRRAAHERRGSAQQARDRGCNDEGRHLSWTLASGRSFPPSALSGMSAALAVLRPARAACNSISIRKAAKQAPGTPRPPSRRQRTQHQDLPSQDLAVSGQGPPSREAAVIRQAHAQASQQRGTWGSTVAALYKQVEGLVGPAPHRSIVSQARADAERDTLSSQDFPRPPRSSRRRVQT